MRCTLGSASTAVLATAVLATAVALLLVPVPAQAQATPADFAGGWQLTATADLPNDGGTCEFRGSVFITVEENGSLSGMPELFKVGGPLACPPMMVATLTGQLEGDKLVFGVMLGPLGQADFTAPLAPVDRAAALPAGPLQGSWTVVEGPFTGGGGSWAAVPAAFVPAIPTLSWIGLGVLVAMLLVIGAWILHRRWRLTVT